MVIPRGMSCDNAEEEMMCMSGLSRGNGGETLIRSGDITNLRGLRGGDFLLEEVPSVSSFCSVEK